jgi:hypothetical protein
MIVRSFIRWLTVLIVCAVYLAAGGLVLWMPCRGELLIGFCSLGKLIITVAGGVLLGIYLLLVWVLRGQDALWSSIRIHGTILLLSIAFLAIPVTFVFGVLRRDSNLQPYAIDSLRRNGSAQIEFVSFSDTPIELREPDKKLGFIASGVLRVRRSGRYLIYPIRLKGEPARILTPDGKRLAEIERRYLEAGETYQFDYFVDTLTERTGSDCSTVSWKVLWQVESVDPFPLYIFGRGAFAQVYPEDSGDYAYVTHINPDFQTGNYTVCTASSP